MPTPTPSSPSSRTTAARDKAYSAYEASLANKRGTAAAASRRRPRFDEGYAKDLAYRLNEDFPMWSKRAPGAKPSRFPEIDALSRDEHAQLASLLGVLALRRQIDAPYEHRSGTVYALGTGEYVGSDSEFFLSVLQGEWGESMGCFSDEELLKLRVYYGIGVISSSSDTLETTMTVKSNQSHRGALPEGFLRLFATAAYQIEGGYDQDGRGPSVWDIALKDKDNGTSRATHPNSTPPRPPLTPSPTVPCMFWSSGEQYMHAAQNLAASDTQHAPDLARTLILEETTLLRKRMRARGAYVGAFWPDADADQRDVVPNFLTFFATHSPRMACAFPDWEFVWSDEPDKEYVKFGGDDDLD